MQQRIQFCTTSDGVRIAYASVGEGPPIVKAPNWLTHLEYEWESPVWRHWWQELSRDHRVIRFDQRGSGLSDWTVEDISFEAWVRDLEAVVDAVGVERFTLLGISQGGPVAIEYETRHPERVSKLVLVGTFARGRARRGARALSEFEALNTLTREGWGRNNPAYRRLFTMQFMAEATEEQMHWFDELQRLSTSPETAARIQRAGSEIDVLDRLPLVKAPTLVLHAVGDERVPLDLGRQVAALIPGARFVTLPSRNHLPVADEPAWRTLVDEVRSFLGAPALPVQQAVQREAVDTRLTPREIEVLRLIAVGKSNQEIAGTLYLSLNTVANHVKSILSKTGTTNRTEAAAFAHRSHLLGSTTSERPF